MVYGRSRVGVWLSGHIALIAMGLTLVTAVPAAAADLQVATPPSQEFSPDGDGVEDQVTLTFSFTEAVSASVRVLTIPTDGTAPVVVRTLLVDHPEGREVAVAWDGLDDDGLPVPAGDYTVTAVGIAADGGRAEGSLVASVPSTPALRAVQPTPDAVVSGTFDAVVAHRPDVRIEQMQAAIGRSSFAGEPSGATEWRAAADSAAADDVSQLMAMNVVWVDKWNFSHFRSLVVPVTVDNAGAEAPRIMTGLQSMEFSPDGDEQDDHYSFFLTFSEPVTFSATASDAAGRAVRHLAATELLRGHGVVWDGRDDAGVALPPGEYRMTFVGTDADGNTVEAEERATLSLTPPAVLAGPVEGATASGLLGVAIVPRAGTTVTGVSAHLSPDRSSFANAADPDGSWRLSIDIDGVPDGAQTLSTVVQWIDAYGFSHQYVINRTVPVDNSSGHPAEVRSGVDSAEFSPDGDQQDDTFDIRPRFSEPVATVVEIRAVSGGPQIRRLEAPDPTTTPFLSWDGLDDTGRPVPPGDYDLTITATDSEGDETQLAAKATVSAAPPISWTPPEPDALLVDVIPVVVTARPGIDIQILEAYIDGSRMFRATEAPADGIWRLQANTTNFDDGDHTLAVVAYWTDAWGTAHYFSTGAPIRIGNLRDAPPILVSGLEPGELSPNGDFQDDVVTFSPFFSEPVTVTATVSTLNGAVVAHLEGDSNTASRFPTITWDGFDDEGQVVPAGDYDVEVSGADSEGLTASGTVRVTVHADQPVRWTQPGDGATVSGRSDLIVAPRPGLTPTSVRFWIDGSSELIVFEPAVDGSWRRPMDWTTVVDGEHQVSAEVRWLDSMGRTHVYATPSITVIADNTLPTAGLTAELAVDTVRAVDFEVTASDPDNRPLTYELRFGDGSAAAVGQLVSPYNALPVRHVYAEPGVYTGALTVSDRAGHSVRRSVTVSVSDGSSNAAPTMDLAVDSVVGTAPFDLTTTVEGADPDGDPLQYRIDFGDGGAVETGALPAPALQHRYTRPGRYLVRAEVGDGRLSAVQVVRVVVAAGEPLTAAAGDDRLTIVGESVTFDAAGSRPTGLVERYEWDFGDGETATSAAASHTYAAPGTYQVRLRTHLGDETAEDTAEVEVVEPDRAHGLFVSVFDGGALLAGAEVFVTLPDGAVTSAVTDGTGVASIQGLDDGPYTAYVYAEGFQVEIVSVSVVQGRAETTVSLRRGDIAATTIESRRLNLEEIQAAGIEVDDPANAFVYEFEAHLNIDPFVGGGGGDPLPLIVEGVQCEDGCSGGAMALHYGELSPTFCPPVCSFALPSGHSVEVRVNWVGHQPVLQYLVIPGEARFLKEFFEVKLVVQNLNPAPLTFTDGTGELRLPAGLSLAPTATPQTLAQAMPDIAPGASGTVTWVVRGDLEGQYQLSGTYTAVMSPIGRAVSFDVVATDPLQVYGASALQLVIDADAAAYAQYPYDVRVGLRNVSPVPVYNAAIELKTSGKQNYIYQPREQLVHQTAEIPPGETFWADYVLVPTISGTLDLRDSFVLHTGGNADLVDVLTSHEPAQTPATAPHVTTFGYETKVVFAWDAVPGATGYQLFRTPDDTTDFGAAPESLQPLSPTSGWVRVPEGDSALWAVSPDAAGAVRMRHPLVRGRADQEYPRITGEKQCTDKVHQIELSFFDPIFTLGRYEVVRTDDGTVVASGDATANPSVVVTIPKLGLDVRGEDFVARVTNAEGDHSRDYRFTLRSVCVRFAALGDSFSAGEGAFSGFFDGYDSKTVVEAVLAAPVSLSGPPNGCHRSTYAMARACCDGTTRSIQATEIPRTPSSLRRVLGLLPRTYPPPSSQTPGPTRPGNGRSWTTWTTL